MAGVRWVFKGAAVHRTRYSSAGSGVSGSKYSLEPKGKAARAVEENVAGRIRPKTESWRNIEWFVVMDCRTWELKVGARFKAELCLIIQELMLGMGFGSSVSSTFRVFSSALRYCYASLKFVACCPSVQADHGMLDRHFAGQGT